MIVIKLKLNKEHAAEVLARGRESWADHMLEKIEKLLNVDGVNHEYLQGVKDTLLLLRLARP